MNEQHETHSNIMNERREERRREMNIMWRQAGYSVLFTIIILIIVAAVVYAYRVPIFDHFASASAQNLRNNTVLPQTGTVSGQSTVVSVVHNVIPSVVSIVVSQEVPVYERSLNQDPYGFFQFPQLKQNGTKEEEVAGGTGFFVSNDGLIVTNKHVVSQTNASYTVITNDGKKHDAKVVARDPFLDVALLKIDDGSSYQPLQFGDSDNLDLGQTVIAIGNALGEFQNSVSVGVISGLSRSIVASGDAGGSEQLSHVIQTDAAINPGNSGGPLLGLSGQVIGINVAVAEGTENIGFSIPANTIKNVVESYKENGEIVHPYIGVRYIPVTKDLVAQNNLSVDYGALVASGGPNELAVIPGSPADKAGIVENDIILSVDGEKITEDDPLSDIILKKKVGQSITLDVLHKSKHETLTLTLQKAPQNIQ